MKSITQRAHDVRMTSYRHRCDVMTSHRRRYDVILTSCARWEVTKGSKLLSDSWQVILNPFLTNGFSHRYHLGESTFILRDIRSDSAASHLGYTICLCTIKRMPGLYELNRYMYLHLTASYIDFICNGCSHIGCLR